MNEMVYTPEAHMHFTPIWYPDGNYSVAIVATDVWTPSGMIESRRNSNVIAITEVFIKFAIANGSAI